MTRIQTFSRLDQLAAKRRFEDELARIATMTCKLCGQEVIGYEEAAAHDRAKHPETI